MKLFRATLDSPVGLLELVASKEGLREINFGTGIFKPRYNDILRETQKQLREYFQGKRKKFTIPLDPEGTDFQIMVWKELSRIPWGKTVSYGDVARATGKPGASRAVGQANGKNPIPIVVPCHRVIGARGKITGYSGGVEIKKWLLTHEGCSFKD